jgi:hypothetical protein
MVGVLLHLLYFLELLLFSEEGNLLTDLEFKVELNHLMPIL